MKSTSIEDALRFGAPQAALAVGAEGVRLVDHQHRRRRSTAVAAISASGATSPLIEYRPSTTTRQDRGSPAFSSFRARSAAELWRNDEHPRAAQSGAVVDARVAFDVEDDGVVGPAQAGNHRQVRLVARS